MFKLSSTVYLDNSISEYIRLLTINKVPEGPLKDKIKRIKPNKLSEFNNPKDNNCCLYVIRNTFETKCSNNYDYLTVNDSDILLEYLVANGYKIQESLTRLTRKNTYLNNNDNFICYFTYS